ncbi:DNA alkylation repair protein [Patescibacteria group bacterium]|nr:DNA alkylation repair protein [Patescibacteria group bacterium]
MNYKEILKEFKSLSNPENVAGMARFGIKSKSKIYGIRIPELRRIAKKTGKDHKLALELWSSRIHEARILASMIDESEKVTKEQMEDWVKDFDSWDVCDQVCGNLFDKTEFAFQKAIEWADRKEEFVKRASFAIIAWLAVHNKKMEDKKFLKLFVLIKKASTDERNFVKKAVNWALRQIGKRNLNLNKRAIALAKEIKKIDSKSAKWIAADAIRELTSEQVQERLRR